MRPVKNKKYKTPIVSIRLPKELRQAIDKQAKKALISRSEYIVSLLQGAIAGQAETSTTTAQQQTTERQQTKGGDFATIQTNR